MNFKKRASFSKLLGTLLITIEKLANFLATGWDLIGPLLMLRFAS